MNKLEMLNDLKKTRRFIKRSHRRMSPPALDKLIFTLELDPEVVEQRWLNRFTEWSESLEQRIK